MTLCYQTAVIKSRSIDCYVSLVVAVAFSNLCLVSVGDGNSSRQRCGRRHVPLWHGYCFFLFYILSIIIGFDLMICDVAVINSIAAFDAFVAELLLLLMYFEPWPIELLI